MTIVFKQRQKILRKTEQPGSVGIFRNHQ